MQSLYDVMSVVGSLVVMVLVIAITYYGSRWYAKRMKSASSRFIKILDKVAFGPGCSIAIVQAGEKFYLVGISDKNIQLLCELSDFDPGTLPSQQEQLQFGQLFKSFLNKADNPPKDSGTK